MSRQPLHFLTAEQVVEIHEHLLERWGGLAGGGHRGSAYEGVEAVVQAVKNSYYDKVDELSAAYAVCIVQGHVFQDGNKRTGAAAMRVFLEANGIRARIPPSKLVSLMIEVQQRAEAGADVGRLVHWIAETIERSRAAR